MYIAIEGVIGVGKTTLARLLQPSFDANVLLEVFEENPFLVTLIRNIVLYQIKKERLEFCMIVPLFKEVLLRHFLHS